MTKERNALTISQRIDAAVLIRANMRRVGTATDSRGRGFWEYINDYSDERVAQEIGCNIKGVAHIRREDRGNYPPATVKQQDDEVSHLQTRLTSLELWCAELHGRYHRILQALVQSRIILKTEHFDVPPPIATAPPTLPQLPLE